MSATAKAITDLETELSVVVDEMGHRIERLERDREALLAAAKEAFDVLDEAALHGDLNVSSRGIRERLNDAIAQAES